MKKDNKRYFYPLLFITVFTAIFVRYVYFGFEYYPQLDDYIQYHNYATSADYGELLMSRGLLSVRPLAGASDLYIWSRLYGNMIVGVAIISALYAASALLLYSLFRRHFGTGVTFIVLYTLAPVAFEGTYWMSASTRIVTGLFFASLAGWIFDRYCKTGRLWQIILWVPIQLVSLCYYEQAILFSLALTAAVGWINRYTDKIFNRRVLLGLLSLANVAALVVFTSLFPKGDAAARAELVLPFTPYYFREFLPDITGQMFDVFVKGGLLTTVRGYMRGIRQIVSDGRVWYIIVLGVICTAIFSFARKAERDTKQAGTALALGAILAAAPLAVFFVVANPYFPMRCAVCVLPGIALMADTLLGWTLKSRNALAAAMFAAIFCTAGVSEIRDYRDTYLHDRAAVDVICDELAARGVTTEKIGILGLEPSHLKDQNFFYHTHVRGVTADNWSLYGAVTAEAYRRGMTVACRDIVPLSLSGENFYAVWNREIKYPGDFDLLYVWDEQNTRLVPASLESEDDKTFIVYVQDKRLLKIREEKNGIARVSR